MSKLRGSNKINLTAVANTLKLLLDADDINFIKSGIRGIISHCETSAKEFDKKK